MKTEAANAFAEYIWKEANTLDETAKMYAVSYAKDNDPKDRALYFRYSFAADQVRKLHSPACQALHAVECLIPDTPNKEEQND